MWKITSFSWKVTENYLHRPFEQLAPSKFLLRREGFKFDEERFVCIQCFKEEEMYYVHVSH